MYIIIILNLIYGTDLHYDLNIINYILLKECPNAYKQLIISVNEYNNQINDIAIKQEDYLYCVRPSYSYPFIIEKNKIYFPLPHLLGRCITSSLYYRLTNKNNELRTKMGKEVLEHYLYDLISNSNIYDEVLAEQEYIYRHNKIKTSDVMIRQGEKYLFLDSKSTVPISSLRIFDENAYLHEYNIITHNLIQIYKNIKISFPSQYNFFDIKQKIDSENIYGITISLEDTFIRRELLYEKVAQELKIAINSDIYNWVKDHIKIVSLYDIEKFCFSGNSIIDELEKQKSEGRSYDYSLSNVKTDQIFNSDYLDFQRRLHNNITEIINNMKDNNIIQ